MNREVSVMADGNDFTTTDSTAACATTEGSAGARKGPGGVRSEAGKRASRANAVKDSLRSKVVFTPEVAALVVERTKIFTEEYRPQTEHERMLISDMAIAKARFDRAQELLALDEHRRMLRVLEF